ncbi:MAG: glucose-6-phosphate dehydrogenase [Deltaproteobacteria bacterium]|nr:glucose-6-phosphate dehydrogenase [Deltaproteobacteria bacterium]
MISFQPHQNSVFVIYGATGDLAKKKLYPALYQLHSKSLLSNKIRFIGVGRTELNNESYRELVRKSVSSRMDASLLNFLGRFTYCNGSVIDAPPKIRDIVSRDEMLIFYFALKPELFEEALKSLACSSLLRTEYFASRFLFEKPFGVNRESAEKLNNFLKQYLWEDQIYRIDHYLAKDLLQNMLVMRFSNDFLDDLLSKHFVDHIQVTVAEDAGIENRADYFDKTGIVRDMFQNHVLQTIALCLMEKPSGLDPQSFGYEKAKVLTSLSLFDSWHPEKNLVRAQYETGFIKGKRVVGYLEESGVPKPSLTETMFCGVFECRTPRWHGVPIFVRVGKRLPKRIGHISFVFKNSLGMSKTFQNLSAFYPPPALRIEFQPRETISLQLFLKSPEFQMREIPGSLELADGHVFSQGLKDGYSRLLFDVLRGDRSLFAGSEEILHAWEIVDPILSLFDKKVVPLRYYPAGSWGPKEAFDLIESFGKKWEHL